MVSTIEPANWPAELLGWVAPAGQNWLPVAMPWQYCVVLFSQWNEGLYGSVSALGIMMILVFSGLALLAQSLLARRGTARPESGDATASLVIEKQIRFASGE